MTPETLMIGRVIYRVERDPGQVLLYGPRKALYGLLPYRATASARVQGLFFAVNCGRSQVTRTPFLGKSFRVLPDRVEVVP